MWQNKRSFKQEIIDLGPEYYSQTEYTRCLELLCRVNKVLGGFRASKLALKRLQKEPESVLEIGCGGGYYCHYLHQWYPEAKIIGIDISQPAIDHAKAHLPTLFHRKVSFSLQQDKSLDYAENSFDIVTSMLVCHHMTDEELVTFLKESYRICSEAVIVNDLQRHLLAYLSFSFISPFLFPNRLIWHDGRLSVKRSFQKKDWIRLLKKAGFKDDEYVLSWWWAFRWTLTLKKS